MVVDRYSPQRLQVAGHESLWDRVQIFLFPNITFETWKLSRGKVSG